ncbi:MAG: type II CAAX prenyl endopeptidase Rce1 family protein [Candidatus Hodarchaeota archaeon]
MSDNNKKPVIKYCVHCGASVDINQTYCPRCGKLVLKTKSEKAEIIKEPSPLKVKKTVSRKCPGCGSIITSSILEQCPICNTKLEKLTKDQKLAPSQVPQKSSGFIFTDKKLIPEQKLMLKKDIWNLREGISVFGNSLMAYITIRLLIIMLLTGVAISDDVNIFTILLSQIPEIIFGVYPLWYIYSKKHRYKKLGFESGKKMLITAFIIAIVSCIILFEINFFSDIVVDFMYNSGITFGFDLPGYIAAENQAIQEAGILWIILLIVLINISSLSTEIVFRGVLHNTLRNHFQNDFMGRATVIIIVALVYSLLLLVFFLPVSIYFFLLYFLNSIFLGIIFEVNNNIYNTILANFFYNIVLVIIILFF